MTISLQPLKLRKEACVCVEDGAYTFMNAEFKEEISNAAQEQKQEKKKKILTRSVDTSSNWV